MQAGAVFRTSLDRPTFDVMSPAGANGCRSSTGVVGAERRRVVVSGGQGDDTFFLKNDAVTSQSQLDHGATVFDGENGRSRELLT